MKAAHPSSLISYNSAAQSAQAGDAMADRLSDSPASLGSLPLLTLPCISSESASHSADSEQRRDMRGATVSRHPLRLEN